MPETDAPDESSDRRSSFQPDIYQRYEFLRGLTRGFLREGAAPLRVLDVGSGPTRLAELFLGPGFSIVRADVSDFGEPDIHVITPGEPLPFDDGSFDLVLALEVLEHVPADSRAPLVRELERLSRMATIVCCPVASEETVRAEAEFARWAADMAGRQVDFLAEHLALGLPEASDVVSWFGRPQELLIVANAPLDEWLAFNTIDFIYAADWGESEVKRSANRAINSRAPFHRHGVAHYRRFFCAIADPGAAAAARQFADRAIDSGDSDDSVSARIVAAIMRLRLEYRSKLSADAYARDTVAQTLHEQLNALHRALEGFREGLTAKDDHILKLDGVVAELQSSLASRTLELTDRTSALAARTSELAALTDQRARGADQSEADATREAELRRQLEEIQRELDRLRGSRSWRATAPIRALGRRLRGGSSAAGTRMPVGEARAGTVDALVEYGLLDRGWYLDRYPDVAATQGDPVRHYRTRGAGEGRNPHPLFDTAYYLRQLPDPRAAASDPVGHYLATGAADGRDPHPLFDTSFYFERYPDVATAGANPLVHYLANGAAEGRDPHPLFDSSFYLERYPDVAAAGANPLAHFVASGAAEGRIPHPLFDTAFYLSGHPDAAAAGANPLMHYLESGAREGRAPHPLFDASFYLQQHPEVAAAGTNPLVHFVTHTAGNPHPLFDSTFYQQRNRDVANAVNPLAHYVTHGAAEGRDPHPWFDTSFYLEQNPDVAASGMNPLVHYVLCGALEGRDPHPDFDGSFYLDSNPDVRSSGVNPLSHFVLTGRAEGRPSKARTAATTYVPPQDLLPWFNPLKVAVDARLAGEPRLNVLVPGLAMRHLSGGPNTALILAGLLAGRGVRIRLVSTDAPVDASAEAFWAHMAKLLGGAVPQGLELVDAHDRARPFVIGERDIFMATAWWTAQQAKYALQLTRHDRFVYLIQDYEPLLHPASTPQALAEDTYCIPHIPVVNSQWLRDFLVERGIGRFADPEFAESALTFQPAIDRQVFHPRANRETTRRRRLLFYARPTNGLRNLFELGVAALQKTIADGDFGPEWDFVGMGESFDARPLGGGATLDPAPWLDLVGYAAQMRESDILLSLMLSPHPSYPPLEMAASAGLVVTTTFANKSAASLAAMSRNIIGVAPTIEGIAAGLRQAVAGIDEWPSRLSAAAIGLPQTWRESLDPIVEALVDRLLRLQGSPELSPAMQSGSGRQALHPSFRRWPSREEDVLRLEHLARRATDYPAIESRGLLSFLTPVWNTDPVQLSELAESVLGQDVGTNHEWVILDNASDRPDTLAVLDRIAQDPRVRLHRLEQNLGIIAGTRFCLERSTGRYAATVDHDDLLAPDSVRVLTYSLARAGYPLLAYTDEDKLDDQGHRDAYLKPDWDPVLFTSSCYIAHLLVFDRERALQLDAYSDRQVEGSHDWDTFMRFVVQGTVPLHVPEAVYTWRMHEQSTAGNIHAKPYVFPSHQCVLGKFIASLPAPERFTLEASPLFNGTPDWHVRRARTHSASFTTLVLGGSDGEAPRLDLADDVPHRVVTVPWDGGMDRFISEVERCVEEKHLVHLLWTGTRPDNTDWPWEAQGCFEMYPDTAIVGGCIKRDGLITSAASYLGFGRGCDSPDRGRAVTDPGYFAQMWKPHSASAVPLQHCVVDATFLADWLASHDLAAIRLDHLGAWLGAFAAERARRVVYSPFVAATSDADLERIEDDTAWQAFRQAHRRLLPDARFLSPHLGLTRGTAYRAVPQRERLRQLRAATSVPAPIGVAADRMARAAARSGLHPRHSFSLLTSVYIRTEADLFGRTIGSALSQRWPFAQWVLLVNGPVTPEVEDHIQRLSQDARLTIVREPVNVGIVGAMRRAIEQATGDFVVPLDADDLLEPDTLERFDLALQSDGADLVFADEAIISGEEVVARFARPGFDPVLNLETSYIWHPCAFSRLRAMAVGVYSDAGCEYCHDWDTVLRFVDDGARVTYVPHVLYQWRTHAASQSHSGAQNRGSIESARRLLERVVARQQDPSLYEVRPFPLNRGAEEWYIQRRHVRPPAVDLVVPRQSGLARHLGEAAAPSFPFRRVIEAQAADDPSWLLEELSRQADGKTAYWALTCGDLPASDAWIWEAIRLFELHPTVDVVSGRLVDRTGRVVDAGRRTGEWSAALDDFVGLDRTHPGPFALALKPHCIARPSASLVVVRDSCLHDAVREVRDALPLPLPELLAASAERRRQRIVYSPLVESVVDLGLAGGCLQ